MNHGWNGRTQGDKIMFRNSFAAPYLTLLAAATDQFGAWLSVWLQLLPVWISLGSCIQLKRGPVEGFSEDAVRVEQGELG